MMKWGKEIRDFTFAIIFLFLILLKKYLYLESVGHVVFGSNVKTLNFKSLWFESEDLQIIVIFFLTSDTSVPVVFDT